MKLIAVDKTSSSVCLIDAATLKVLKRLPMPLASHDLAIAPDGRHAFISIYGNGVYGDNSVPGHEIIVVDLKRFEQSGSVDIHPYTSPHGLAFDRTGILWATCDAHSCLLGIYPRTACILHMVNTRSEGTHWVLASVANGNLYTSNKQEHFISEVDPTQARMTEAISVPNGTEGICFSPDGKLLYAADHREAAVLEIDVATRTIRRSIGIMGLDGLANRSSHHMRVAVSADGTMLVIAAYHFDRLILIDLIEAGNQVVIPTGRGPTAMAFDPQTPANLYFSNHDEGSLGVVDTVRGALLKTANCDAGIEVMRIL